MVNKLLGEIDAKLINERVAKVEQAEWAESVLAPECKNYNLQLRQDLKRRGITLQDINHSKRVYVSLKCRDGTIFAHGYGFDSRVNALEATWSYRTGGFWDEKEWGILYPTLKIDPADWSISYYETALQKLIDSYIRHASKTGGVK